ncbi:MAG: hypothetical protein V4515_08200 [Chloroflexota bacterium]
MAEGGLELADGRLELSLHLTHPRIPEDISPWWTRSAAVCLSRHHTSPQDFDVSLRDGASSTYETGWEQPTDDHLRALGSELNTTEYGAYCVALAAAHAHLGRMALARTGAGTGADWWLVPIEADTTAPVEYDLDREDLFKLEVSGVDRRSEPEMKKRLAKKIAQVQKGRTPVAERYAAVVGFEALEVRMVKV